MWGVSVWVCTCHSSPVWKSILFTMWIPGTKLRCESKFLSLPGHLAALLLFNGSHFLSYSTFDLLLNYNFLKSKLAFCFDLHCKCRQNTDTHSLDELSCHLRLCFTQNLCSGTEYRQILFQSVL